MSLSRDDVERAASRARLALYDAELDALCRDLSAIIGALAPLDAIDPATEMIESGDAARPVLPLRPDRGPPLPMVRTLRAFAAELAHGYFVMPDPSASDGGR